MLQSYELSKLKFSRKSLLLWPFQPKCVQARAAQVWVQPGSNHSQSLMAGNFVALWPTDLISIALKDLNPSQGVSKVQDTGSILRVGLALSKWPHFHRVYLVAVCKRRSVAVFLLSMKEKKDTDVKGAVHAWTLNTDNFGQFLTISPVVRCFDSYP